VLTTLADLHAILADLHAIGPTATPEFDDCFQIW